MSALLCETQVLDFAQAFNSCFLSLWPQYFQRCLWYYCLHQSCQLIQIRDGEVSQSLHLTARHVLLDHWKFVDLLCRFLFQRELETSIFDKVGSDPGSLFFAESLLQVLPTSLGTDQRRWLFHLTWMIRKCWGHAWPRFHFCQRGLHYLITFVHFYWGLIRRLFTSRNGWRFTRNASWRHLLTRYILIYFNGLICSHFIPSLTISKAHYFCLLQTTSKSLGTRFFPISSAGTSVDETLTKVWLALRMLKRYACDSDLQMWRYHINRHLKK